ncbi:MAG: metalloregulator ArsR/SmtB family transcription factor [Chloroflexota bacterium]
MATFTRVNASSGVLKEIKVDLDSALDLRELRTVLKALGDVERLRIVQLLAGYQEISVSHLTQALRISQPLASWHLRILRKAGIISRRKEGRQAYCSLNRCKLAQCQEALAGLVGRPGAGMARQDNM